MLNGSLDFKYCMNYKFSLHPLTYHHQKFFIYWFILESGTLICCSTRLCIHRLLLICPLIKDQTATMAYQCDALTNWPTWPGPRFFLSSLIKPDSWKKVNFGKLVNYDSLFEPQIYLFMRFTRRFGTVRKIKFIIGK